MTYDHTLANRVKAILISENGVTEKEMFGGIGFLINGNMACGVIKDTLIVRVGSEQHAASMSKPHTRLFDMTGKAMKGWITVEPAGCVRDDDLQIWVKLGLDYALHLPLKK